MKIKLTLCLALVIFNKSFSQTFNERKLKTKIYEVTVFLSGAQIFEKGIIAIPSGQTILKVEGLSPYLDEKSIQIKAEGDFTILSVNHRPNYLNELMKGAKSDSLKRVVDAIESAILRENSRLEVLKEKQSLLNENKKLGGPNSGITLVQLKQAIEFYEIEFSKIKDEEIKARREIEIKKKEQHKLEQQLKEVNDLHLLPSSEIEIRVSSEAASNAQFNLTYIVENAGWYPKYDIRVQSIEKPLDLTYKAEVFQNTGVDWTNVKLRFSNGDPSKSGLVPELNPWNLNLARNTIFEKSTYGLSNPGLIGNVRGRVLDQDGEALPGVNVVVKSTSIGTVTDANGNYSITLPNGATDLVFSFIGFKTHEVPILKPEVNVQMEYDVQQLNEIVVTGSGLAGRASGVSIREDRKASRILTTTMIENQTTVEIEVETPYSIKSNGEKLSIDLKKYQIDAFYEYYAIPKIDKDAFLIARIVGWDQYNLLEGEANLYFEDTYVGRSILDAGVLKDTLNVSLGRDRNIVIGRDKNKQYSKRRTVGTNSIETRGFNILVRNKKSEAIKLTLFDQIPVAVVSEIVVSAVELTKGQLNEKTGQVTWVLDLLPQQQTSIDFQYEVKYPRRERIVLE